VLTVVVLGRKNLRREVTERVSACTRRMELTIVGTDCIRIMGTDEGDVSETTGTQIWTSIANRGTANCRRFGGRSINEVKSGYHDGKSGQSDPRSGERK
jgi:hypothetical protein